MEADDTGQDTTSNNEKVMMERNIAPNKKQKLTSLDQLTREEVEARVRKLESHNQQLQNLLIKSQGGGGGGLDGRSGGQKGGKAKKTRPFDFTKHSRRHVLLKFAYLGWDYQGYAAQEDTQATIEAQLFPALLKTRLIQSRETSNYHRCGRTDKGVSAFEQVISLTLRSNCRAGVGVLPPPGPPGTEMPPAVITSKANKKAEEGASCRVEQDPSRPSVSPASPVTDTIVDDCTEINYVLLLNRVLPAEIRMLAWSPVSPGYSARFDCSARTYKYFFPRANFNLDVMQEAASELVGHHDFRNFCKMDVANGVVSFIRRIRAIKITTLANDLLSHADQRRTGTKITTLAHDLPSLADQRRTFSSNTRQRGGHGSDEKMMNGCEDQEQPKNTGELERNVTGCEDQEQPKNSEVPEIHMTNTESTTSHGDVRPDSLGNNKNTTSRSQTTHHNVNSLHSTHQENENPHSMHQENQDLHSTHQGNKDPHSTPQRNIYSPHSTHQENEDTHSTHQENYDPHSMPQSKKLDLNSLCRNSDNFNPPCMNSEGYEMCVATIEGEAFLWHQIRCIMAVLMLVGEGLEDPSVVTCLLDVNKQPRKPQYKMASEIPLNLYGTSFEGVLWRWDDESLYLTLTKLQHLWTQHSVRANMIRRMLWDLEHKYLELTDSHHSTTLSNQKQEEESVNKEDNVNTGGKIVKKGSGGGSSVIKTAVKGKRQNDEEKEKGEWKREKEQEKIDSCEKDVAKRDSRKKIEKVDHLKKGVNITTEKETSENNKRTVKHKENQKMDHHKKGLTDEMETENREGNGASASIGNKRPTKHKDGKITSCPQESTTLPRSLKLQSSCLVSTNSGKVYRPLLSLPTCESLETRVQHYVKRQRLDPDILLKLNTTTKYGGNS